MFRIWKFNLVEKRDKTWQQHRILTSKAVQNAEIGAVWGGERSLKVIDNVIERIPTRHRNVY